MKNCEYKIIDNFLTKDLAQEIKNIFVGNNFMFPWYFNESVIAGSLEDNLNNYQLTHIFYKDHGVTSAFFSNIFPIIQKLNPESILRIKANLNTRADIRHTFEYHVDFDSKANDRKTAIYYVNTNDGVTILEDGTEIESIANRLVIFDQKTRHTGTTCTNQKVRCLINFNYIERCDD